MNFVKVEIILLEQGGHRMVGQNAEALFLTRLNKSRETDVVTLDAT